MAEAWKCVWMRDTVDILERFHTSSSPQVELGMPNGCEMRRACRHR